MSSPILSPEIFDEKVKIGEIKPDTIQACTMMTLDRYNKDAAGVEPSDHWIQQCPPRTEYIMRGWWLFKKKVPVYTPDPLYHIGNNRDYFRWQMGIRDAIHSIDEEAARTIFSGDFSDILYLNKHYHIEKPLVTYEDLRMLVIQANTYQNYRISETEAQEAVRLLLTALETIEKINMVLSEARERQGVQVIYGINEFKEYLATFGTSLPQGDIPYGLCLPNRIPEKYITAVLPVGKYEQQKLL